jgi:hypothetical protein
MATMQIINFVTAIASCTMIKSQRAVVDIAPAAEKQSPSGRTKCN